MNVYFISGIGGDSRLFRQIRLPAEFRIGYVEWILPEKGEPLPDYACRLTEQIDTWQPFILVGLSLGGIMSVEIAKRFSPVATILIGSIPVSSHLPLYYTIAGQLRLPDLLPPFFFKKAATIKRLFTREKSADKEMLRQVIRDGNPRFIKWGLKAVLKWRNEEIPQPLWHIHGSRDGVFPVWLTRPSHIVSKGGHLLVINHAAEVNGILAEILPRYLPSGIFSASATG
ncbi:MAG TPA: alpha/beta hydrolase [Puia sp.]|nr:alpha/beta hydrolase [Puia sp.]